VRQRLSAAFAAPLEARCALAVGTDRSIARSVCDAEADVVAARAPGAVVQISDLVSTVPDGLTPSADPKLENDEPTFASSLPQQALREQRAQDQTPGVERAEFLLTIGYGLPRGP